MAPSFVPNTWVSIFLKNVIAFASIYYNTNTPSLVVILSYLIYILQEKNLEILLTLSFFDPYSIMKNQNF